MATFFMTIGLPGCGKSTWAKNRMEEFNANYVSSDSIREEVFGNVNDQSNNYKVFSIMKKLTLEHLKNEENVIYDATNINRRRRVNFLKELPENTKKVAILFAVPFEICCKRNKERTRTVPEDVMLKFYKSFHTPWYGEGFDEIYIVNDELTAITTQEKLLTKYKESKTIPHDNPHHTATIGDHMENAYNYADNIIQENNLNECDIFILKEACKWHDIGKVDTKVFHDMSGNPTDIAHFYGHASVSAYDYLCSKTTLPETTLLIANLINTHMVFFEGENAIKNLRSVYNDYFWKMLEWVHECDIHAD